MKQQYKTLRLVLGDQLNASHSWFQEKNDHTLYLIAELHQETSYVVHHIQKVAAFFAAMKAFSIALNKAGHHVLHLTLDDTKEFNDLPNLISHLVEEYAVTAFEYQLPDEYRLREQLSTLSQQLTIDSCAYETQHFYLTDSELSEYFTQNTKHRMEHFYRKMRSRFDILMNGSSPQGGQWNYDADNRNKMKADDFEKIPEPLIFENDCNEIIERINAHEIKTMGAMTNKLYWPINRSQSLALLKFFCQHCLKYFGRFQDAMLDQQEMTVQEKYWSLLHSRLSFSLNSKMITPHHVVNQAIEAYQQSKGEITIAQIEGFVRQIIGWREFIRGIYWLNMPQYSQLNHLNANNKMPSWFWTGKTKMNCLRHAISQSLEYAYAHHIQRLMVTGNFCLISGIDPTEVDAWYLGIYIDAIEWVELPNTRGMSQFADGGIVGSKAYAASGNYVNKMSNYCSNCHYKVNQTVEESACPLNSLYWHFMDKHQDKFTNNPRSRMVYANWRKKTDEQRQHVLDKAKSLLINIESL